ncbi:tRNA lysidine(34) synthetase TilS [Lysinibacillus irui]|uniref:tRNA(Ile)-lysidine synthase n=1 Tax=Lysinibacillus irui TaxID=2998077 RepID=A0ABU5NSQ6_9BACI|nr:tRNA lysidine(34) synthetase TilS [Lysinibacillus irui]MEA0555651.1 tRNA lysidine(34) synthetase TilS [Lysinibacillus irui]MEA0979095.1 tRNA lysidine(34) synthetase TilS [Lysinibacillus irui]MEA1045249.1 tRNA lysidine(34) synthetase TilS [Lysinibacillus irui]
MSFELKVKTFIEEEQLLQQGDHLLIAVSGGVDSMALLHYFVQTQEQWNIQVEAVHVDHMLRGQASAEDRAFVQKYCDDNGVSLHATEIPVPTIMAQENGNTQLICRRERYRYFKEILGKINANKLVTAHHADDQLESVLMALTKNATMNSMQGIRPQRLFEGKSLIRPFLTVTKSEIREYLLRKGLDYREDASNSKDTYVRNRFRHHVVPLLEAENPRVTEQITHFTKHLQVDDAFLMSLAQDVFSQTVIRSNENTYSLEIEAFQLIPLALQRRLILILLNYLYKDSNTIQSFALLTSILKLCDTTAGYAEIHLPEDFLAVRRYGKLTIQKNKPLEDQTSPEKQIISIANGWTTLINGERLCVVNLHDLSSELLTDTAQLFYFNASKLHLPLYIRARKDGDKMLLKGMDQPKRLSRLFIDEKIPLNERNSWPLLISQTDEVVAVIGVRMGIFFSTTPQPNDDTVLIVD